MANTIAPLAPPPANVPFTNQQESRSSVSLPWLLWLQRVQAILNDLIAGGGGGGGAGLISINADTTPAQTIQGAGSIFVSTASGGITTVSLSEAGNIELDIDGGGTAPLTGYKGMVEMPYSGNIIGYTLLADASCSAQITARKSSYAAWPTTVSIVGSAPPALSSAQKTTTTSLPGWTTSFAQGDVFDFTLDSLTGGATRLKLQLFTSRT